MNGYSLKFDCGLCGTSAVYREYEDILQDREGQWMCHSCLSVEELHVTIVYDDNTQLNYYQSSLH